MHDNKITFISLFKTGHCRGGCEKAPPALTSDRPFTTYQEPIEPKETLAYDAIAPAAQLGYFSIWKVTNSTWDQKERRNRVSISESFWQKPTAEERLSNTAQARAFLSKVTLRTPFSTSRKARSS